MVVFPVPTSPTILRKPFTEVIGYIYNAETGKREVFAFLYGEYVLTEQGTMSYEGRLLFHYKNKSDGEEITEFINANRPFPYYEIRQYSKKIIGNKNFSGKVDATTSNINLFMTYMFIKNN